ncbi:MAG TPA: hypothetical protein VEQ60_23545 [Longimicrobium sp.]|nr:hypothetical protein [Longimicrobium sp.]
MTAFFCLLGAGVLWVLYEIVGTIAVGLLGEVLGVVLWPVWRVLSFVLRPVGRVLGPVLRPIRHLAEGPLGGRGVALLWLGALASYCFFPYSISDAASPAARAVGLVAFPLLTLIALVRTMDLRHRRRPDGVIRRGDLYVPPPDSGPASR